MRHTPASIMDTCFPGSLDIGPVGHWFQMLDVDAGLVAAASSPYVVKEVSRGDLVACRLIRKDMGVVTPCLAVAT